MIPGATDAYGVPSSQEFCTDDYWKAFDGSLQHRLQMLDWKPFIFIKIFKLGLHWVVVFRAPDLSTGKARLTYWVTMTWSGALAQAATIALPLRTLFQASFVRIPSREQTGKRN